MKIESPRYFVVLDFHNIVRALFLKAPLDMGSRLDPAFGVLGVGAPGRYLSGGSLFLISRVAATFH